LPFFQRRKALWSSILSLHILKEVSLFLFFQINEKHGLDWVVDVFLGWEMGVGLVCVEWW
jgi:hypothetical protein